ncbi:MAG: CapA family protein [Clostridiales bacterium]|nr:CapA family protein [Clostridiales bacterium]
MGKIIIGADIVSTAGNEKEFINGEAEKLVGKELKEILDSASFVIANLEVPLCREQQPLVKSGPCLIANPDTINGYKALNIKLLALANNHTMDQSAQGFISTMEVLKNAGIDTVGGGMNQEEAAKPYIFELEGKKIGVYACAEHEYGWARDYGLGANGFDPLDSLDEIADLKSKVDYCIVLYHGGREHYRYPTPRLKKVCRKIIDKGADIVLCQHTHCVGAGEEYNGGTIVYGMGNFLFDYVRCEWWDNSILVSVDVSNGFKVEYIPIEQVDHSFIRVSKDPSILEGYFSRSEQVKDDKFLQESFHEYAMWMQKNYYYGNIFKEIMVPTAVSGRYRKAIENCIRCEVHREMVLESLREETQDPMKIQ